MESRNSRVILPKLVRVRHDRAGLYRLPTIINIVFCPPPRGFVEPLQLEQRRLLHYLSILLGVSITQAWSYVRRQIQESAPMISVHEALDSSFPIGDDMVYFPEIHQPLNIEYENNHKKALFEYGRNELESLDVLIDPRVNFEGFPSLVKRPGDDLPMGPDEEAIRLLGRDRSTRSYSWSSENRCGTYQIMQDIPEADNDVFPEGESSFYQNEGDDKSPSRVKTLGADQQSDDNVLDEAVMAMQHNLATSSDAFYKYSDYVNSKHRFSGSKIPESQQEDIVYPRSKIRVRINMGGEEDDFIEIPQEAVAKLKTDVNSDQLWQFTSEQSWLDDDEWSGMSPVKEKDNRRGNFKTVSKDYIPVPRKGYQKSVKHLKLPPIHRNEKKLEQVNRSSLRGYQKGPHKYYRTGITYQNVSSLKKTLLQGNNNHTSSDTVNNAQLYRDVKTLLNSSPKKNKRKHKKRKRKYAKKSLENGTQDELEEPDEIDVHEMFKEGKDETASDEESDGADDVFDNTLIANSKTRNRRQRKYTETFDQIMSIVKPLEPVRKFNRKPGINPLVVCFDFPGSEITHVHVKKSAEKVLGSLLDWRVVAVQFIPRNAILGTTWCENRWAITVNSIPARNQLIKYGIVVKGVERQVRALDDVNAEEYRSCVVQRMVQTSQRRLYSVLSMKT